MGCIHKQEIDTAASWHAANFVGDQSWLVHFTDVEIAALNIIDSITQDPAMRIDLMLEPGDIQLANSHMVMHSRTSFEDDEDPARYRKKLRLWLKMDNARRLAPDFPGRNGFG